MKLRAALVALALSAALVPLPARLVDRVYSNGIYAALQPFATALSNRVPVALLDALLLTLLGAWIGCAVFDWRRRRKRGWRAVAAAVLGRSVAWAAALYLAFLLMWGFNYRRTPLADRLPFDADAVTAGAVRSLALTSVTELNRLHGAAHAAGWVEAGSIDPTLSAAFRRVQGELGGDLNVLPARPKRSLLDWYFRRAAVDGMTDPYFLETLVSSELLPFERPFVLAHEWSHLAGVADEGDANFVGWLTCVQAAPPQQYGGWLFLYAETVGALDGDDRRDVVARLGPGPRADLAAIRARLLRSVSPRVSEAGWRVYDRYLKANRVEAGAASYAQVVRLVAGVRFTSDWHIAR